MSIENKIEKYMYSYTDLYQNMKPNYSTNQELNCGVIEYNSKIYLVDMVDQCNIINFKNKFLFFTDKEDYPSYCYNYKRINYLDFIYKFPSSYVCYYFKNGNKYDLRKCNVEIHHLYYKNIKDNYNIISYIQGHISELGVDANIIKNPLWTIIENDKEYLLMYCEKDTICKLCSESYQKILDYEKKENNNKKLTWHKNVGGYIVTHLVSGKLLYIHQIIMNCYGNGKGTKNISVDHIDQNPLNNSLENLRIATRKEQENNQNGIKSGTKRERKHNAIQLPEGITQDMMRKYVVYYHEWLDKEHTKEREFFKVEKHPKLDKIWFTSKSNKISIQEKLDQANKVVDDLENDIYPEKNSPTLPKYVSLIIMREKEHLVYEKRIEGKRLNLKMVLPTEYDLAEQIEKFDEKIKEKYNVSIL
jgi:hypothetical protein